MMINLSKNEAEWLRALINKVGGTGKTRHGVIAKLDKLKVEPFPSKYYQGKAVNLVGRILDEG